MSTTLIPTDRHGDVYWGATTYADAEKQIKEEIEHEHPNGNAPREVAEGLERAGYPRIAARIRREWSEWIEANS